MKKLVLVATAVAAFGFVGAANAADMPSKAPIVRAPMMAPVYSWTGFYIGAQGGGAWGTSDETFFNLPNSAAFQGSQDYDISGGIAGGVVGFNYQFSSLVFGIEGDFNWANISGTSGVINVGPPNRGDTYYTKISSYESIKGRIGYAWDRALVYVNGGGAWGRVNHQYNAALNGGAANSYSATSTQSGWTMGGGLEYAFLGNWTGRIEYNYVSLGTGSIQYSAAANNRSEWTDRFSVVKIGLNYKFGAP